MKTTSARRDSETDLGNRDCTIRPLAAKARLAFAITLFLLSIALALSGADAAPTLAQKLVPSTWRAMPPYIGKPYSFPAARALTADASIPYGPAPVRGAYGIPALPLSNTDGTGVTVAIVDAFGDINSSGVDQIQSDLAAFCNRFALPYNGPSSSNPTLTVAHPNGPPSSNETGWGMEVALDCEWVHSMAPGAKILLVISPDNGNSLYDAVTYAAQNAPIVSMSWGGGEFNGESSMDSYYFGLPNVSYFVSTGDDGAGVSYPSASPNVTAVGGTSLWVDSNDNWLSETGWGGSGGGVSSYEALPSFQSSWVTTGNRSVPDIAALADPDTGVLVYQGGGWNQVGGTSLATPLWAGFTAILDANRSMPIGEAELHSDLYTLGAPASLDSYFHDITSGSNGYSAKTGYDYVTGIGAPVVNALLPAMTGHIPTILNFTPTGWPVSTNVTINGNDLANSAVAFNGVAATVISNTATQIVATVPDGATTGPITATNGDGTATSTTNYIVGAITPTISSISPTSVAKGAGSFTLTVSGSNFTSGAQILFGATPLTSVSATATTLTATVPATALTTAGPVSITVTNPAPNSTTSTSATLMVTDPQSTIASVLPATAIVGAAPFTLVVNGTNFYSDAIVSLGSTQLTTTYISPTKVTALVPTSAISSVGSLLVTVYTGYQTSKSNTLAVVNVNYGVPSISSVSPATVLMNASATAVTVTGTNFQPATVLKLGSTTLATTHNTDGSLTVTIPASSMTAAGNVLITAYNPTPGGGTSAAKALIVNNPVPAITAVTPSSVPRGTAFSINVTGTSFVTGAKIYAGTAALTTTANTNGSLTATVPATSVGNVTSLNITVLNPTPGGGASDAATVTVVNAVPTITAITPTSVQINSPSFTLTVTGAQLVAGSTINLAGTPLTTTRTAAGTLTATIPATALTTAAPLAITITAPTPGGGTSTAVNLAVNNRVPVISTISPSTVVLGSGSFALTVTGTNIITGSAIVVAGTPLTTTLNDDGSLTATAPASDTTTAGPVVVAITAPTPGGGTSPASHYTVNNPVPAITAVTPPTVTRSLTAFTLNVTGTGFVTGAKIAIGITQLATTASATGSLTALVPQSLIATASSVNVTVVNPVPGGGASDPAALAIDNAVPTISSISPATVLAGAAAFKLTVTGWGFVSGSTINLAGTPLTTTGSSTVLSATIPASAIATAGPIAITVTAPTPGGGTSTAVNLAVNNVVPVITTLSPNTEPLGTTGISVTVIGTGFVTGSQIVVAGTPMTTTLNTDGSLTAAVPDSTFALAANVPVTVLAPTPGGGSSKAATLSVTNPVPVVTAILPATVVRSTSPFSVNVTGTSFETGAAIYAGTLALTTTANSDGSLTATVPAASIAKLASLPITVKNLTPGGGASNAIALAVTNAVPVIATITPSAVTVNTATAITIAGTQIVTGSTATINGVTYNGSVNSTGSLVVTIPATALTTAAPVSVVVTAPAPGGGASNSLNLTVNNRVPAITSITPPSVVEGSTSVSITVKGLGFVANSQIAVAGTPVTTTLNTDGTLTATVPDSSVANAGTVAITVIAPTPGGGTSPISNLTVTNPKPTIASISPSSVTRNSGAFTVVVTGTNFVATSKGNLAGVALTTTLNTDGTLSVAVPASSIVNAGTFALTVVNPTPGGGTSTAATLTSANVVPTITALSPSSVTHGAAATKVTVTGTGIVSGTVVKVGTTPLSTTYLNGTVSATIPASLMTSAGSLSITVVAPTPGGGASAAGTFTIN